MNRNILMLISCVLISFTCFAQTGKTMPQVKLLDVNDSPKTIPYLGEKVFTLFYVDPDVQDVTDPLSDALNAKKYPKEKYGAIGVVNCKDTWFPNSAILAKAKQKQNKFPESLILLDKDYVLSNTLGLGKCNDVAVILVIGKDAKIKFAKSIKTETECRSISATVIKIIEGEIRK